MSPAKEGESELYERMVREAMERLRFSRKKAETMAQKLLRRFRKNPKVLTQAAPSTTPKKKVSAKRLVKAVAAPIQEPASIPARKTPGKQKKPKNQKAPERPLTKAEIAKLPPADPPRPPPRNAKERMERALGPDDGKRRRGGSPVVQGGSPGLGRRR